MTSNTLKITKSNDTVNNIFNDMNITYGTTTTQTLTCSGYEWSYNDNGTMSVTGVSTEHKKPEVSEDVKTIMKPEGKRIRIKHYDKGFYQYTKDLMPDIVNVTVYNNRVVAVDFADGTREKLSSILRIPILTSRVLRSRESQYVLLKSLPVVVLFITS